MDEEKDVAKMNMKKNIDDVLNEAGLSVRQILIQFITIGIILFSTYHTIISYFTGNKLIILAAKKGKKQH